MGDGGEHHQQRSETRIWYVHLFGRRVDIGRVIIIGIVFPSLPCQSNLSGAHAFKSDVGNVENEKWSRTSANDILEKTTMISFLANIPCCKCFTPSRFSSFELLCMFLIDVFERLHGGCKHTHTHKHTFSSLREGHPSSTCLPVGPVESDLVRLSLCSNEEYPEASGMNEQGRM